jgi:peptidyl-prolyl cis-trans isomerase C
VDGYAITLSEFQAELALYKASKNADLTPEDEKRVLDDLVDQALLVKGAEEMGFVVDEALVDERINALIEQLGSPQALSDWQSKYGFDDLTFRHAMSRSVASAWMRDQIAAAVPKSAEQVHARQILLYNSEQAGEIYGQLQAGNSFENLALKYDPVTGGDLGWFPRGYLPDKEIEEAAFGLQLEQYSSIIKTSAGYHILQPLERDPARSLSTDALLALQTQAVVSWIKEQREKRQIEVLLP